MDAVDSEGWRSLVVSVLAVGTRAEVLGVGPRCTKVYYHDRSVGRKCVIAKADSAFAEGEDDRSSTKKRRFLGVFDCKLISTHAMRDVWVVSDERQLLPVLRVTYKPRHIRSAHPLGMSALSSKMTSSADINPKFCVKFVPLRSPGPKFEGDAYYRIDIPRTTRLALLENDASVAASEIRYATGLQEGINH